MRIALYDSELDARALSSQLRAVPCEAAPRSISPVCSHSRAVQTLKMALHVPKAPGFAQMLKDGAKVSFVSIIISL